MTRNKTVTIPFQQVHELALEAMRRHTNEDYEDAVLNAASHLAALYAGVHTRVEGPDGPRFVDVPGILEEGTIIEAFGLESQIKYKTELDASGLHIDLTVPMTPRLDHPDSCDSAEVRDVWILVRRNPDGTESNVGCVFANEGDARRVGHATGWEPECVPMYSSVDQWAYGEGRYLTRDRYNLLGLSEDAKKTIARDRALAKLTNEDREALDL